MKKMNLKEINPNSYKKNSFEFFFLIAKEEERNLFKKKLKKSWANKKNRGEPVGNPNFDEVRKLADKRRSEKADEFALKVYPKIKEIKREGFRTYARIAKALQYSGIRTSRNRAVWSASQVRNITLRAEKLMG